jgi:hypothetical protein
MSGDVGRSLLKDLVLLAASLCLLLNSLGMTSRRARRQSDDRRKGEGQ